MTTSWVMMPDDKKKNQFLKINPYDTFARYYNDFMNHVPYKTWSNYLYNRSIDFLGHHPHSIVDLGCGTGVMLSHLKQKSAKLTGIDGSSEMINKAQQAFPEVANWVESSLIKNIPLPDQCTDFAFSSHDCLNYILKKEDLLSHFIEVRRILEEGGLYSTDFVTLENMKVHYDGQVRNHILKDGRLRWGNTYDPQKKILESRLDFYNQDKERTCQEIHYQRFYSKQEIQDVASLAGLSFLALEGDYNRREPKRGDSFWNFHFQSK